ncbi:MAG: penicillin-binding transpeptidase domain-containing protein, partial [Bacillota bacterium]|nr:penicillin-binding transpeptidase domain-containing protein [Bacillota bacterium]
QNIRGVQKASEYYFGKPVNELSLSESALLAGVINAPNLYNPYNNLDYAQQRRDEVLQMMLYHGYISEAEYNAAVKTKVIDLLSDDSFSKRGVGEGDPYQAFIDEVVDEVYELTGQDPYTTSMKIYTTMDKVVQTRMDEIQAEVVDEKYYYKDKDGNPYFFPDDKFEIASICVDNKTGEIYGILGGRNYADGGALLLNHATQQKKQPGSAIKPILDYSQAFEVLGWSTSHYVVDEPITYPGTQIHIGNSNGYFQGIMPLKTAVYESLNTPAISTLWEIMQHEQGGNEYLANYMNSIGFNIDPAKFEIQYGIGGSNLNVSCLQMAGAQAMLINLGEYNKPHTITKIEYPNDKAPFIYKSNPVQAISPQAAYLTTELLKFNVSGDASNADGEHYANFMELFRDKYQVYAKTGTSNWDSSGRAYGIPNGYIKDGWTIASTSKVTIATWIGYEKAEKEDDKVYGYIPYPVYNRNLKGKITRMIVNTTVEEFGKPEDVEEPEGIVEISHVAVPGKPYLSLFDGVPEDKIASGLIKESAYELEEGSYTAMEERINSSYHPEYEEEQEW